ncbi:MAG: PD40 domain-containing protein, partial [Candidatus Aminicenantes bacterium]|nr:PD40 domain-containing protein [Candidatus Aminicenantes bacterium]
MKSRYLLLGLLLFLMSSALASAQGTRLLRRPSVSSESVVFSYGGDLWIVSRNGGAVRRLTATPEIESDPFFSPDGSLIAFTAVLAGNTDVYVVAAAGGQPLRLTYHPEVDVARGWTPDSRRVVFASSRDTAPSTFASSYLRLWTIGKEGGFPEALPMPTAVTGNFSPDARRIAYEELSTMLAPAMWATKQSAQWRHYRGGRTHPIKVMNLGDYSVENLPWENSNDTHPMWVDNTIYFLSDRNFTVNLFAFRTDTKELIQITQHDDFDIMNASAGPDAVVYEQAGYIHLVDIKTGRSKQLSVEVTGDFPWALPQRKKVAGMIRSASLSPSGVRAAFEARGDIFTVPANKGDTRNLTQSPGVHDRNPAWSPDGKKLAWFSDTSGEYQLFIGEQRGLTKPKAINLPVNGFFSEPIWSPDGTHIMFQDNHKTLWMLEVKSGRTQKVDTDTTPKRLSYEISSIGPAVWSPDSKWIAYANGLPNSMRAIFLYSLAEGKTNQLTDGMADATSPAFDASGKYLYFLASTNYALKEMTRPVTHAIYLVVLSADEPSPLLPETGDEPEAAPETEPETSGPVRVDFEGIGRRVLALNEPDGEYTGLKAGKAGTIFYTQLMREGGEPRGLRLQQYQLMTRTAKPFLEGIRAYALSADKKKLLYQAGRSRWGIVPADRPSKAGEGALPVNDIEMRIDPKAEWAQIYREAWRLQREFFYDSEMQGADWPAIYEKYLPFVPFVRHRSDLGYLMATVGGELTVGHSYLTSEGDLPGGEPVSIGMLGADFAVEHGKYRIRRIYTGEDWNPHLSAPLSAPGIEVADGDYLLEVNGQPLAPPVNVYSLFEGTAGKQTLIRVNAQPSLEGSRVLNIVPVASEMLLRTQAWVEGNRRRVDCLSKGRLAYVWLQNTSEPAYRDFVRYYYAQQDKEGVIIDERFNQGGRPPDYLVHELAREHMGYFVGRDGAPATIPELGNFGPKVMIVNESAGSGG